jgi:uncharacterized membrane protein (UPF0127 family)
MNIMRYLVLFFIVLLPSFPVYCAPSAVTYSRSEITITRVTLPPAPTPLPWRDTAVSPDNPKLTFEVEVRDADSFYRRDGLFTMNEIAQDKGLLLLFDKPKLASIPKMNHFIAIDIVTATQDGTIVQILPNIKLYALEKEIKLEKPAQAILLFKGGLCAQESIHVGDVIDFRSLNQSAPAILINPQASPKAKKKTPPPQKTLLPTMPDTLPR